MDFDNNRDLDFTNERSEDLENTSINLSNIQNEFQNLNLKEYSTNADLLSKIILSSQSACLKTGSSLSESNNSENTIKINEDDLIDRNDLLKRIFQEFIDKNECIIDNSQSLFVTKNSRLSKSIQRKLVNLNQSLSIGLNDSTNSSDLFDLMSNTVTTNDTNLLIEKSKNNQDYKKKIFRFLRALVERVLIDALSFYDQYINQIQQQELMASQSSSLNSTQSSSFSSTNLNNPTSKLWIEIRNRGCQFLGPQMQDDVLRLTLHALETVNRMSRKVLVLYVVHMLKKHYPKASKTSVGHVIQLLYRAGCFIVEKRDNDSSLMELRKEFTKYPALRKQHDMQIIQIALESGIRMSPEQWSQKLFGDSTHKSEMQSIIDKIQSQQTLDKLIQDFYDKVQVGSQSVYANQAEPLINSLFLAVKVDLEYFDSINFEKKIIFPNEKITRNSIESPNNIGSGGESLSSEDDDFSFDDLMTDFEMNESYQKFMALPQAKITWSLLTDCMKRTVRILTTHLDYTSKMSNVLQVKNQNLNNNKMSISLRPSGQSSQQNLNIMINGLVTPQMNNNQNFLLPMGPGINKPNMISKNKFSNQIKSNQKPRNDEFIMNRSNNNCNQFNFGSGFTANDLGFGFSSNNKIWSDETASVSSNSSSCFNSKNKIGFSSRNSFNGHNNLTNARAFQDQNPYQNNLFDSNSIMMNAFQSDQQFYPKLNL
ncbi:unnamed protein product, partial [Brachionus calyciflorus]